ncbi:MAG: hypothetical protein WBM86_14635 [Waterburya sp.]
MPAKETLLRLWAEKKRSPLLYPQIAIAFLNRVILFSHLSY